MKNVISGLIFSFLINSLALADQTCSRVAQVNHQNILVDTNSHKKGEGLRYHLEKDPLALKYLDIYQDNAKIKWSNALLGTLGTGLMIYGAAGNNSKDTEKALIISGATMVVVNYLISKTFEKANEKNLMRAISEYNKRNLPRIYFSPDSKNSKNNDTKVYLEKNWNF